MTDRAKFEAMLEALINEDQETAKEIFHNIVVAKSREIYEELLAEGFGEEEEEESSEEEEEEEEGEEEEEEGSDDSDVGGDATDDFVSDVEDDSESDDFGGEGEGDLEDRVMDLEDALEELKSEFDSLMADEQNEPEHNDGIDDPDFGGEEDDFGGEEDDFGGEEETDEGNVQHHVHHFANDSSMPQDEFEAFMEYVNKVALPKHGDNGVNTKSVIDNMKNDMGGTNANIAQSFSTEKGGTEGGLASPKAGDLTSGLGEIHNRPGGDAGKKSFKNKVSGHGGLDSNSAQRGQKSAGAGTGKTTGNAENTKAVIGKRVR